MRSAIAFPVISFVEFAGFRGARDLVRVEFGSGFTVISGRNGTGKSTVCDAIEFALLGRLTRFDDATERGESFGHYVWWQGATPPPERFVAVGFRTPAGDDHLVCRRPDRVDGLKEVAALLCNEVGVPADFEEQICRTAILRGESIAQESVDLPERQRYALVRAAIGSDVLGEVEHLGPKLVERMNAARKRKENEYYRMRNEVQRLQRDLAEAHAAAFRAGDPKEAADTISKILTQQEKPSEESALSDIAAAGHALVVTLRSRMEQVVDLGALAKTLTEERSSILEERERGRFEELSKNLAHRRKTLVQMQRQRQEFADEATSLDASSELMDRLAVLLQYGRVVGLRDGKCPLCAHEQEGERYLDALATLEREVDENAQTGEILGRQLRYIDEGISGIQNEIRELEEERDQLLKRERQNESDWQHLIEEAGSIGVSVSGAPGMDVFDEAVSMQQRTIGQLDGALARIDSSFAAERVSLLRTKIGTAQQVSNDAERALRAAEQARDRAKSQIDGVMRAIGEVVEERLATLEPLLQELYARLRPHVDWQEIEYNLRGQVRRFLSLQVGEDLNPRFMFSSGQRRAAGLAFLLAVYFARPWCKLHSLIMDDPVQHIDDYRALHLVEALSAIRQGGHQVVCTVEDPALARLLLRRLNTGPNQNGVYIGMEYELGTGVTVAETRPILPTANSILTSA